MAALTSAWVDRAVVASPTTSALWAGEEALTGLPPGRSGHHDRPALVHAQRERLGRMQHLRWICLSWRLEAHVARPHHQILRRTRRVEPVRRGGRDLASQARLNLLKQRRRHELATHRGRAVGRDEGHPCERRQDPRGSKAAVHHDARAQACQIQRQHEIGHERRRRHIEPLEEDSGQGVPELHRRVDRVADHDAPVLRADAQVVEE
mmetsp:Transcript_100089/g.258711  ORF Transcript_100089/g.258711 Transcript_100089/m.258711 type:complete len:207 (+) Transcript_100089:379-999(+)